MIRVLEVFQPTNGRRLALSVFTILVLSLLLFVGFAYAAKANDCGPHEIDGQCGIGTLVGTLWGAFCGVFFFIGGSAAVFVRYLRLRREGPLR